MGLNTVTNAIELPSGSVVKSPHTSGDVDWKAVMAALVKVDYRGYLSPEIGHDKNDPDQLQKVSRALDKILAMA